MTDKINKKYSEGDIYNITFWGAIVWMFLIGSFVYIAGLLPTLYFQNSIFAADINGFLFDGVTSTRLMISMFLIELNSKFLPSLAMLYIFRKSIIRDFYKTKDNLLSFILMTILMFYIFISLSNFVAQIYEILGIRGQSSNQETIVEVLNSPIRPIGFVLVVIMAPLFEELIFRKTLFGVVEKKFKLSPYISVLISTFVFSLIHVLSPGNLIYIFQYIPLALVISASYMFTDNIFMPIGLHFINNLISFMVI